MFPQHSSGGGHYLFRVGQTPLRLIQVREEMGSLLRLLAVGNVGRRADDLPHTAVFVPRKDSIAALKPAPLAVPALYPVIELDGFVTAQVSEAVEVIEEWLPIVRMHHGMDEFNRFPLLPGFVTERGCEFAIDKDFLLTLQVVDIDQARRDLDNVLRELLARAQRLLRLLAVGHVTHNFRESAQPSFVV